MEARSPGGDGHVVVIQLHPGFELGMELHHPDGDAERQAGLPLVGGDHHHLGAVSARQQLIQGQHGGKAGLALASGQHPPGQPRPRPRIPGGGDQLPLPGPQAQGLADPMAAGHPNVVEGEPCDGKLAPSGAAQGQRGAVNVGLGAGLHGPILTP
jgi:hypothetical protein